MLEKQKATRPDWLYKGNGALKAYGLAEPGIGWKLHLNFDPDDAASVKEVENHLSKLILDGQVRAFKIGKGGGKADGAPGKEATIYVGPRDVAEIVAANIEDNLGSVLSEPEGDTLLDDRSFTPKVMGRFDISKHDPDFHQYGVEGTPFLQRDIDPWNKREKDIALAAAEHILIERYGAYYTGNNPSTPLK